MGLFWLGASLAAGKHRGSRSSAPAPSSRAARGTIRADAAHRPRGSSNDRLGPYPRPQDLERIPRRLAKGCSSHFPEGLGPLWDQGTHRPAVLGRRAGQTRNLLSLGTPERWIAGFAALGAFGTFVVNLTRFVMGL